MFFRMLNLSKKADNVKNIPYFDGENVKFLPFYGGDYVKTANIDDWMSGTCRKLIVKTSG